MHIVLISISTLFFTMTASLYRFIADCTKKSIYCIIFHGGFPDLSENCAEFFSRCIRQIRSFEKRSVVSPLPQKQKNRNQRTVFKIFLLEILSAVFFSCSDCFRPIIRCGAAKKKLRFRFIILRTTHAGLGANQGKNGRSDLNSGKGP